jgi:hypothetical protein
VLMVGFKLSAGVRTSSLPLPLGGGGTRLLQKITTFNHRFINKSALNPSRALPLRQLNAIPKL